MEGNQWNDLAEDYSNAIDFETDEMFGYGPVLDQVKDEIKNSIILDYGCGNGKFTRRLKKLSPKKIYAVDSSEKALKLAKNNDFNSGADYFHIGNSDLPFIEQNSLDFVFVNFVFCCIEEFNDIRNLLKIFFEKLKKDGKLIILEPHPKSPGYTYVSCWREKPSELVENMSLHVWLSGMKNYFYDYWRSKQYYLDAIIGAGFIVDKTIELKGEDEKKWKDEVVQAPNLIMIAAKS